MTMQPSSTSSTPPPTIGKAAAEARVSPVSQQQQAPIKRFECARPGCGKLFNRKEHLTRHLKSHDPEPQHQCHICGRRYARSDVLKRHVEHHPQITNSRPTVNACTSCHERKVKCDDSVPCKPCLRNGTECSRSTGDWQRRKRQRSSQEACDITAIQETSMLPTEPSDSSVISPETSLIDSQVQQLPWMPSPGDAWNSMKHFSIADVDVTFPDDFSMNSIAQWAIDSSAGNHDLFPLAPSEPLTFLSPPHDTPHDTTSQTNPSRPATDIWDSTASLQSSQSPASIRSSHEGYISDLVAFLHKDLDNTKRLIRLYFAEIHPSWPLLHAPTFDVNNASKALLGTMLMLASWFEGGTDHEKLDPMVFDAVNGIHLETHPSLQSMQALLLFVVYTIYRPSSEGMLSRAALANGTLISICRHRNIFNGHHTSQMLDGSSQDFWLATEQLHRLAFSVLRVDAYLSILVDHPPSVRYQEMSIPLPKSTQLWTAATAEERRRLQWNEPAGREKSMFCVLMRDTLEPSRQRQLTYPLTESDYHLSLCAYQVGIWEAAREAHSSASDELVEKSTPGDPIELWRGHLNYWRGNSESDCHIRQAYFAAPSTSLDHILSPVSLVLWHSSALKMHAPLDLLQCQGAYFKARRGLNSAMQPHAHLRSWLCSSCPRTAVWNAAQITRVVIREFACSTPARASLNPIAIPGILTSAIVACSYAYYTRACPDCTGCASSFTIDLFSASDDDVHLETWKLQGEGLAIWGPTGLPVCRCKVMELADWFREVLARDQHAQGELMNFLVGLAKE